MSTREIIQRTIQVPSLTSGHTGHEAELTAEVRVHYPRDADPDEIARAVLGAVEQVLDKLASQGGYLLLAPLGAAGTA